MNTVSRTTDVRSGRSPERSDQTLEASCDLAIRLVRNYFEHVSDDADDAHLNDLLDAVEAAVARVVRQRATACADIAGKYKLQSALRPHRAVASDLMAALGASINIDLARVDAAKLPAQTPTAAGTWFGRVLSSRWSRYEAPHAEQAYEHAL